MKVFKLIILLCFLLSVAYGQNKGMGAILQDASQIQTVIDHENVYRSERFGQLPTTFFLNTPPVGDQGDIGSCVGWSVGYLFGSVRVWGSNNTEWTNDRVLSPSFVYNGTLKFKAIKRMQNEGKLYKAQDYINARSDCNAGLSILEAFSFMTEAGACSIQSFPYTLDCNAIPAENVVPEAQRNRHPNARLPNLSPVFKSFFKELQGDFEKRNPQILIVNSRDVETLKLLLTKTKTPIVVGFNVTEEFETMWRSGGQWIRNGGASTGSHAVGIVGYDDHRKMFKVQNSWGTGPGNGDNGFFWVTYDLVRSGCFREAYAMPPQ